MKTATHLFDVEQADRSDAWHYLLCFARTAINGRPSIYYLQATRDVIASRPALRTEFADVIPRAVELAERLQQSRAKATAARIDIEAAVGTERNPCPPKVPAE
jgi:hypothetical protein